MSGIFHIRNLLLCANIFLIFAFLPLCVQSAEDNGIPAGSNSTASTFPLAIITNHSVTTETIDKKTLRAIFGKQIRQWPDGQPVRVIVLNTNDHEMFCESYLNVLPYVLERYWSRLTFSGRGTRPYVANSLEEMLSEVALNPGAIGYVPEDLLNESVSKLQIQ